MGESNYDQPMQAVPVPVQVRLAALRTFEMKADVILVRQDSNGASSRRGGDAPPIDSSRSAADSLRSLPVSSKALASYWG
jgi:hypothetical protein